MEILDQVMKINVMEHGLHPSGFTAVHEKAQKGTLSIWRVTLGLVGFGLIETPITLQQRSGSPDDQGLALEVWLLLGITVKCDLSRTIF